MKHPLRWLIFTAVFCLAAAGFCLRQWLRVDDDFEP